MLIEEECNFIPRSPHRVADLEEGSVSGQCTWKTADINYMFSKMCMKLHFSCAFLLYFFVLCYEFTICIIVNYCNILSQLRCIFAKNVWLLTSPPPPPPPPQPNMIEQERVSHFSSLPSAAGHFWKVWAHYHKLKVSLHRRHSRAFIWNPCYHKEGNILIIHIHVHYMYDGMVELWMMNNIQHWLYSRTTNHFRYY